MDNIDESFQEEPPGELITSDDELNTSFQELDVDDCDDDIPTTPPQSPQDHHCHERTIRTPAEKHALTPESKAAAESKPKRFAAYNLSSHQCNERRQLLSNELEYLVQYKEDPNAHIKQSALMDMLSLQPKEKSLLTRTVKATFPNSTKKIIMVDRESIVVYTNLLLKSYGRNPMVSKELFKEDNKDILAIQDQIKDMEQCLLKDEENIASALDANNMDLAKTLSAKHCLNLQHYFKFHAALVTLYQHKIQKLQDSQGDGPISMSQKEQIAKETKVMEDICCIGLKAGGDGHVESVMDRNIFADLLLNFEENCPLLHSVLETLLVTDSRRRVHKTAEYKLTCGVNALALLLSVRNQRCKNDVRLLLSLVCITYGAGKQFINLLNAVGLTPHWDTLNNFLDEQLKEFPQTLSKKCPDTTPVLLLMDNINLYRGRKRHLRLMKDVGPKMWNFTGRAVIIPDIKDIEDNLMCCRETAMMPQRDIASITADDLFLESMPEHKKLWDDWCDRFHLELIDKSLNDIPTPPKPFIEMEEAELNSWLSKVDFAKLEDGHERKFKVTVPTKQELCRNSQTTKTDVINLPLSLEDNSTLTGTASIFEEFSREFSFPCPKNNEIPFNKSEKKFDLTAARTQFDFMRSVDMHHTQMLEMEKQIRSHEKELDGFTTDNVPSLDSESDNSEDGETRAPESVNTKTPQQQKHEKFAELCGRISKQVREFAHSDFSIDNLVQRLTNEIKVINSTRDRYDRTIFHYAVEEKNYLLAKILLTVGVNPNCKEGCGATPLSLAVMNADTNMCKLLLENFAEYSGPIFGAFPSPMEMAAAMKLTDIVYLINEYSKMNENPLMSVLQSDNCYSTPTQSTCDPAESFDCEESSQTGTDFMYKRSVYQGFPTGIVGDVGTCKVNRSVKNRNSTAYGWSTEIPGDMHAKGHLCEATFKAHGKGGFHKMVNDVMKRPKLTEEAFKKRKFQEQNLQHIQEAVRDGSCAYGISAVHEFRASNEFPSDDDLKTNLRRYGNHNKILLERFKLWLKRCSECYESHKYHQQLFCVFGPLLDLFITAGREGDGVIRETSWVLLLPIFAQLDFRNYWTEAFVHVVNFTSLWPLAFRCMVKKNSTVNLSGKRGHNLDMDEYVESYVVKPLKTYSTGHTSVQMCKRLMGNLNLLRSVRSIYSQPNSFNYHQTTKHKTQSALPDVIKGMWFCIRNKFFQDQVSQGSLPLEFPIRSTNEVQKKVRKCFIAVISKGEKKVKDKLKEKLHESFPLYRLTSLESVLEQEEDFVSSTGL